MSGEQKKIPCIALPNAKKDYKAFDPKIKQEIDKKVNEFKQNPKKKGKNLRGTLKGLVKSLRIGDLRLIYSYKKNQGVIWVYAIEKRENVYDRLKREDKFIKGKIEDLKKWQAL